MTNSISIFDWMNTYSPPPERFTKCWKGMHYMTKLLSEINYHRLLCNGIELLVEVSYNSDCNGKRRWLPAESPYDTDVMNDLLRQAFANHHNSRQQAGIVFCARVNQTETMRIVRQPAGKVAFSECIESSSTRDGLGEQIWYDVEDRTTQNNMMASVMIGLYAIRTSPLLDL